MEQRRPSSKCIKTENYEFTLKLKNLDKSLATTKDYRGEGRRQLMNIFDPVDSKLIDQLLKACEKNGINVRFLSTYKHNKQQL